MRLRITFKQKRKNQYIPINYQYQLSSFIYRTIETSNNEFSHWLHDQGFTHGNKKFKFFTFSNLRIPEYNLKGNRLEILSTFIKLYLSILSNDTIKHFIIGMFENQEMRIFDNVTEADFYITTVESLPLPIFKDVMHFKTLSPIIISMKNNINGKQSEYYMNPEDENYFDYLKKNIEEKYTAYSIQCNTKIIDYRINSFKLITKPSSKLITIKDGTKERTQVRGYNFEFEMSGEPEFLKFAYLTGFGKLNSLGFGYVNVV